jgi:1,4-dihydroxy-2-naphthoyl-CoA synthase
MMQSSALYDDTDKAKEGMHAFEEKRMPYFARFRR